MFFGLVRIFVCVRFLSYKVLLGCECGRGGNIGMLRYGCLESGWCIGGSIDDLKSLFFIMFVMFILLEWLGEIWVVDVLF